MRLLKPLAIPAFRNMFIAQALSLIGSGLATVALGLLAYELAGDSAGMVLGIAMAIKMVAYVFLSPLAAALANNMPRRGFLVGLDLARAGLVLFFPFVDQIWQVYLLIFLLFSLTAGFTPVFQATIPDIVKDEETYVNALTLSRVSFNIEAIASPILAGALMSVMTFNWLFMFTSLGFVASALLVWNIHNLADSTTDNPAPFIKRVTMGLTIFSKTPRLRGLMALNIVVSFMSANVYINSIIVAHNTLGGDEQTYLNLLLAFGVGSILAALLLRPAIMALSLRGMCLLSALVAAGAPGVLLLGTNPVLMLGLWAVLGFATSLITTSSGLLLRVSASEPDRPSVFAAQFSLSHACFLVAYLLVAWLGRQWGAVPALWVTAALSLMASALALRLWHRQDKAELEHTHPAHSHAHLHVHDAHHQHPHIGDEGPEPHSHPHKHAELTHIHHFTIDTHHLDWPYKHAN
ncbi:MAG: MFS transporter [Rhodobacterales bacterium]|nr:MAG: MFS transporter [Rhodobacterales bacterium]